MADTSSGKPAFPALWVAVRSLFRDADACVSRN
jgi:hypothetical protein